PHPVVTEECAGGGVVGAITSCAVTCIGAAVDRHICRVAAIIGIGVVVVGIVIVVGVIIVVVGIAGAETKAESEPRTAMKAAAVPVPVSVPAAIPGICGKPRRAHGCPHLRIGDWRLSRCWRSGAGSGAEIRASTSRCHSATTRAWGADGSA